MIFLDTSVLIYASQESASHHDWARRTIAQAVAADGAVTNAVCLAELYLGKEGPASTAEKIRSWGIGILDKPVAAAEGCAATYGRYRQERRRQSSNDSPLTPLPDFFIGAHAQIMGWPLATADKSRIKTYFRSVQLIAP